MAFALKVPQRLRWRIARKTWLSLVVNTKDLQGGQGEGAMAVRQTLAVPGLAG